jgi:hypothetical protein
MCKTRIAVVILLFVLFSIQAFGASHESTYPNSCNELWPAVKAVIGNPDNYKLINSDDAKWTASYDVKHKVHLSVSGAVAQRTNHVTLVTQGSGCQMQVESSFSGVTHDDQGDFKKRVDEALAKQEPAKPGEAAKP